MSKRTVKQRFKDVLCAIFGHKWTYNHVYHNRYGYKREVKCKRCGYIKSVKTSSINP